MNPAVGYVRSGWVCVTSLIGFKPKALFTQLSPYSTRGIRRVMHIHIEIFGELADFHDEGSVNRCTPA